MKFPYLTLPSTTPLGRTIIDKVPMLKIEFKEFYLDCMIDTGAYVSMMPAEFGVAIGLNIKRGEPLLVTGLDNITIPSYIHKVEFYVGKILCKIEVAFSEKFKFPFGLLWRKDFFDMFKIHFYQSVSFFELETYQAIINKFQ